MNTIKREIDRINEILDYLPNSDTKYRIKESLHIIEKELKLK